MKSDAHHNGLLLLTFSAILGMATLATGAEPESSRLIAGIGSAQSLLEDMEYLVADLAGRQESFENNIFPNIDIFLIGVDQEHPIRFDMLFSAENGREIQAIIPVSDLGEFLNDNLDPIDIVPERDRKDRNLYELTGNVYEGWLRSLRDPDYAVIFTRKEWIPKDMEHPATLHKDLVEKGYGLFAHVVHDPEKMDARSTAFDAMRTSTIESIQKRTDETQNAHELRQAWLNEQLAIFQQWFVECSKFTVGTDLDRNTDVLGATLEFSAIPGTPLADNIARISDQASYFAAIQQPIDAVLTARVHLAHDQRTADGLVELYKKSQVVAEEQIDEDQNASDAEKVARKESSKLLNDVLIRSTEMTLLDAMIDVVPSGDHHVLILGVRCIGQDSIQAIVDKLPEAIEGWTVENGVADVGGTKITKVGLGKNVPQALIDLYGESVASTYVAASDEAFWLAFGENAVEELSQRIEAAQSAENLARDGTVLSAKAKATPLVETLNGLLNDEASIFSPAFNRQQERLENRISQREEDEVGTGRQAASAFLTFEWISKVVEAMKGEDDTITIQLKNTSENTLTGEAQTHRAILKAMGTMIANFADENLQ
ncbi:hypothetical protein KOR42_30490 [Thalassoglobus neptunius]|uniref:Uncharacterized protein n=1 Tax=Thalassoglobus neptunius TaxID=1938619 RepID=A0A5C5WPY3_9PLAN|nr:hypothetical protein [Thalassoglobus neptunius]TWT52181.1 hypothetical protein KOR42_30490 [Thalassoglobus neptunius]